MKQRIGAHIKKMSKKVMFLWVLSSLFLSTAASAWWAWTPGDSVDNSSQSMIAKGYKPKQPIPFSHQIHAEKRKIPCEYCHSAARRSISSGIPPLNTCMGCHKVVRTDKDPIKYITAKYEKNEPVEWTKVHDLPDHVRFSHMAHVTKGVACQTCHGDVQKMDVVEQFAPLQMGWCIGCHKTEVEKNKRSSSLMQCQTCHF